MAGSMPEDAGSLYQCALEHQLAGRDDEARAGYLAVLALRPEHAEASHNLGMLEFSAGNVDAALECLMNAVEADPRQGQIWQSLVEVLRALGAEEHAEQAIAQAAEAGLDATALADLRAPAGTAASADGAAPAPQPSIEPVQAVEATIRERARRIAERSAPGIARQVAHSRPLDRKLGERMVALFKEGRHAELEALAQRITRDLPNNPAGWHFLGNARLARGDLLAGLEDLLKANELFPGDAQLLGHLGGGLGKLGYFAEADICFQRSMENRHPAKRALPGHIEVLRNHVACKIFLGQLAEARRIAEDFVALVPDDATANYSMASVLMARGAMQAAIPYLERAATLNPRLMEAFQDLGLAFFNIGRLEEALRVSEQAIEKNPDAWQSYSNLLFFLSHDERISPKDLFERHTAFGERFEAPLRAEWRPHDNDPDPERKLRIGFVSADFNSHAVAAFIEPILENIDRERFDLYGIYNNTRFDSTTERLKSLFKLWIVATGVSDGDLAEIIRAARIDILVDLSGHTAGSRLMTFARKPAPVQMTWVGYPDTTGLQAMDYFITDRYLAPPGRFDEHFTEKLLRLENAMAFAFPTSAPPVGEAPVFRNGYITFGSFNRPSKITTTTLDLWAELLRAVPEARMLIGSADGDEVRQQLERQFESRDIDRARLRFMPRVALSEYLAAHADIDVLLDTFPYNAGTTALYSLWMGVPILTMKGQRQVSNLGAAVMSKVGLPAFVAEDGIDFVSKGAALARQPAVLSEVRGSLRTRLGTGQNFQPEYLAHCLEEGFGSVWRHWCAVQQRV